VAAPTFASSSFGSLDTGGIFFPASTGLTAVVGDVLIFQVLQDGTTSGAVSISAFDTGIVENLAGTDNTMDYLGEFAGGGLIQHLWIGRFISTTLPAFSGANSTSQDVYMRFYRFADVNTGTTLADVIEQNGGTTPSEASGTSNTIADAGVITTGVDRLALNFVGVNDDNAVAAFTGMTGGTWAEAVAEYASSTGTDGCIQLQTAAMATAGTIDGGTYTMAASDGWGAVGFALIGTTPGVAVPRSPGIDSGNAHFCKAWQAVRKWKHGSHGIMVPDIMFAQQGG